MKGIIYNKRKFKGKYRVQSARKPTWNYGNNGIYFVTICTKNRVPHFGTIDRMYVDDEHIVETQWGNVETQWGNVETQWGNVETQWGNVETQNIASLQNPDPASLHSDDAITSDDSPFSMIDYTCMETTPLGEMAQKCWWNIPSHFPFVHLDAFVMMPDHLHGIIVIDKPDNQQNTSPSNIFGPQSKNLASIIRGFKIGVTKFARSRNYEFSWQTRFHDRILTKEKDLSTIRRYIANNPLLYSLGA